MTIKPTKRASILSRVESNAVFREIIKDTYIRFASTYKVNSITCYGLTFVNIDEVTKSRLERFCEKTFLNIAFIDLPWEENVMVAFIKAGITSWTLSDLKKVSHKDIFG